MTHPFEKAGLGKAPFRYVGMEVRVGPYKLQDGLTVGAPGQPVGACQYCGQGIAICCLIRSADGQEFIVGSDCVAKVGDPGLKQQVNRDARKRQKAREAARIAELQHRLETDADLQELLASRPHPRGWEGQTLLDSVQWMMQHAGHAGKLKMVRLVAKLEKS